MSKNISVGGKSYEVSEDILEQIEELINGEKTVEIDSMDDLVGQKYLFQCARYSYHGKVKSVTPDYIELTDCGVVFNTGSYDSKTPEDREETPNNIFVMRQSIETFFKLKW